MATAGLHTPKTKEKQKTILRPNLLSTNRERERESLSRLVAFSLLYSLDDPVSRKFPSARRSILRLQVFTFLHAFRSESALLAAHAQCVLVLNLVVLLLSPCLYCARAAVAPSCRGGHGFSRVVAFGMYYVVA